MDNSQKNKQKNIPPMGIYVVASAGQGSTLLSAFDDALLKAGVSDYNLIILSSIIPPESKVIEVPKYKPLSGTFGHKLYVVRAEIRSTAAGKYIAAGLGWYQLEDGRGYFVEHEAIGETKVSVKSEISQRIKNSLKDMCRDRDVKFNEKNMKSLTSIVRIKNKPACALVIAVYKSESWI